MALRLCYTIWFSQCTGSTLLTTALEATGVVGKPHEWFYRWLDDQHGTDPVEFQMHLWENGSTPNGVFGLKHSFYEPGFRQLIDLLHTFPICPPEEINRARIWEHAFPNHRHIFMTRRNKVRLAVSWWKAIQSQEWHRRSGAPTKYIDLSNAYSFEAIHHLYNECAMREAGIQGFFTEGKLVPLILVYEDFFQEYEKTVRKVLEFVGVDMAGKSILPPNLAPITDHSSEEWTQHFREELQASGKNRGW